MASIASWRLNARRVVLVALDWSWIALVRKTHVNMNILECVYAKFGSELIGKLLAHNCQHTLLAVYCAATRDKQWGKKLLVEKAADGYVK